MRHLHFSQPPSHALSEVPRTGFVYLHRRPGGWMQSGNRDPAQAGRHALERLGCQRHHRPAVCQTQWTLRGFLGTSLSAGRGCRMTSLHKSELHPERQSQHLRGGASSHRAEHARSLAGQLVVSAPFGYVVTAPAVRCLGVPLDRTLDQPIHPLEFLLQGSEINLPKLPPSGSSLDLREQIQRNLFANPLSVSPSSIPRSSSSRVMFAMIEICAPVVLAGEFFTIVRRSPLSHASRMVELSVLP